MKPDLYTLSIDRSFSKIWSSSFHEIEDIPKSKICQEFNMEPIITYNHTIVSGILAYKYYHLHKMPFTYEERHFFSINEAITYACLESLKQPDLTNEKFHYCVGRLYVAQKRLLSEHYPIQDQCPSQTFPKKQSRYVTAALLPAEKSLSHSVIYKCSLYSAAIDEVDRKAPEIAEEILRGLFKLSRNDTLEFSKLSPEGMRLAHRHIQNGTDTAYFLTVASQSKPKRYAKLKTSDMCPEIKRMPKYDPDSEISSLALTIPMWISSINRTKSLAKFHEVSKGALLRLEQQLVGLRQCIDEMQVKIQEESHE